MEDSLLHGLSQLFMAVAQHLTWNRIQNRESNKISNPYLYENGYFGDARFWFCPNL